ncbi:MAG TPA: hypothetical protein VGC91_08105 [Pyrinomonadaceae bacterium]
MSNWWGHLRTPDNADSETFRCKAAIGFRSPLLPMPRRAFFDTCLAIYGGLLTTLAAIADNDCPVNIHLPGGTIGVLVGGLPQLTCSRKSRAVCTAHVGDDLSYLGMETPTQTVQIGQSGGGATSYSSRGNASNLKRPLRVVFGRRVVRDMDLLAFIPTPNTSHPDQGFVQVLFAACEGRIKSMTFCAVNNLTIAAEHLNTRLGARRQSRTSFGSSPNPTGQAANYSGTALFYANYGQVNAGAYGPQNLAGQAIIEGLDEIRVYTTPESYTRKYTTNRAWCLLEMYRNRRWGHGLDDSRFVIQDWIDLAAWCDDNWSYTDPSGTVYSGTRSTLNVDLQDRTTQQVINDTCLFGRFSKPFYWQGKIRIVPLKKESLDGVKEFTDEGNARNICVDDNGKALLTRSQIDDIDLPNQLSITFEDAAHQNIERPLSFDDKPAQLKAGRALGDESIRIVEKKYSAFGVTAYNESVRLGNLLLDLGEFDSGGLKNNLRVTFTTFYAETLDLHPYKVIRVLSRQLTRYGFEYFRIMSLKRKPDLKVEIVAQAYPRDYYDGIETVLPPASDEYEAEDPGNTRTGAAVVALDAQCSGGAKVVGIGHGSILRFNGITVATSRPFEVTVVYKSTSDLTAYVNLNTRAAEPVLFPDSGGAIASLVILVGTLQVGQTYTLTFANPDAACPELDKITLAPHVIDPHDPPGGGVCRAQIGEITYENGQLRIPVLPCE